MTDCEHSGIKPGKQSEPSRGSGGSFITGITGFVGQYLARYLVTQGEKVAGIGLEPIRHLRKYSISFCDILDFEQLARVIGESNPAYIYHLAGLVHPRESAGRPRDYYLTNVQGMVNLLEALRRAQTDAKVLVVSSSKVYGSPPFGPDLMDESLVTAPRTPYAVSKYLAETVARQYWRDYGIQVVIARPFNHSGPGQPTGFVLPDFCKQIVDLRAANEPVREIEVGDLSPVTDFTDVRDVVRAYRRLLHRGDAGEVYNVCSGVGIRLSRMLELVLATAGMAGKVAVSSGSTEASNRREVGDNRKIRECTGWQPEVPLEQTISDTLEYWERRAGRNR